ncbi:MAG: hypothetical protein AVDCRST_MAG96-1138 [uncultured Segetibacter sp.]|uniref:Uncharacterized protein n=1 Tax=uncultured Segetibacter sp. TaxID=481133 RepID=A0A6J4RWJ3_9BACT|nr:MAG: hypothetical protein AVDCRST_MAG96-1138 [uncultured Segetibacter sp.]
MSTKDNRQQLIDFINKNAFDPIIKAKPEKFKEDREALEDLQRKTQNEKKQFSEEYSTAEEVKKNYLSNVRSKAAAKVNAQLEKLGLPTLPQHKDEFMELCKKLEV